MRLTSAAFRRLLGICRARRVAAVRRQRQRALLDTSRTSHSPLLHAPLHSRCAMLLSSTSGRAARTPLLQHQDAGQFCTMHGDSHAKLNEACRQAAVACAAHAARALAGAAGSRVELAVAQRHPARCSCMQLQHQQRLFCAALGCRPYSVRTACAWLAHSGVTASCSISSASSCAYACACYEYECKALAMQ